MDLQTDPAIHRGDADIAYVATLFADRTRAKVLTALADGRALPAGVLAAEAGVSAQAASAQLARLRENGLIEVEQSGRHRYYRLASAEVATILEGLAAIAPAQPISSLRQGTRAEALRRSRTCYDHLAGRLGCAVNEALLARGVLERSDGESTTDRREGDRLSAPVAAHPYRIGPAAPGVLGDLGVPETALAEPASGGRPVLRFCVDWSEQRHHLGGRLGAELLATFVDAGWIKRRRGNRAVDLTDLGATELHRRLGLEPG
jgi:DNA-binding transcriptional ArsR family regulator